MEEVANQFRSNENINYLLDYLHHRNSKVHYDELKEMIIHFPINSAYDRTVGKWDNIKRINKQFIDIFLNDQESSSSLSDELAYGNMMISRNRKYKPGEKKAAEDLGDMVLYQWATKIDKHRNPKMDVGSMYDDDVLPDMLKEEAPRMGKDFVYERFLKK